MGHDKHSVVENESVNSFISAKALVVGVILLILWCHAELVQSQGATEVFAEQDGKISPLSFGAKGNGITDDTQAFQRMLDMCSARGITCVVPAGKSFLITGPLYIWGKANLIGSGSHGSIVFNNHTSPYLINIGISSPHVLEQPFSGEISGVTFKVVGGRGGRILFFWRTQGAVVSSNLFDVGEYEYSATSSGNDNNIVKNGFVNCIRKDLTITNNVITATADRNGSEGIGLGHFNGAVIFNNKIRGVGDDPIGVHFSKHIRIENNELASVDGRIFVSNSERVTILKNRHERIRSPKNGKFETGISLLYVGFETLKGNNNAAPSDIHVSENTLYYPAGSIDRGSAIYLYGPRDVFVGQNEIINDSGQVAATAIRVLPAKFAGSWKDPDLVDPSHVARVHNVSIIANVSGGRYPLPMDMSGNCDEYVGTLTVAGNTAPNFRFYCDNVSIHDNTRTLASH